MSIHSSGSDCPARMIRRTNLVLIQVNQSSHGYCYQPMRSHGFNRPINSWFEIASTISWFQSPNQLMISIAQSTHDFNRPTISWFQSPNQLMISIAQSTLDVNRLNRLMISIVQSTHDFNRLINSWFQSPNQLMISIAQSTHDFNRPINSWFQSPNHLMVSIAQSTHDFNRPINSWFQSPNQLMISIVFNQLAMISIVRESTSWLFNQSNQIMAYSQSPHCNDLNQLHDYVFSEPASCFSSSENPVTMFSQSVNRITKCGISVSK